MSDIKGSSKEAIFPFISPQIGAVPGSVSPVGANLVQMQLELLSEFLPFDIIGAPLPEQRLLHVFYSPLWGPVS